MIKDLIIAFSSGYDWNQIKYWVNSIRKTKFEGDVVIVTNSMKKTTKEILTEQGVIVASYGSENEYGDIVPSTAHLNTPVHVLRFFYMWDYLMKSETQYRYIVSTDIRDVVFQKNPMPYLEDALVFHCFVASSEGMKYENEPWGRNNLIQSFGIYFYEGIKREYIYNIGILAGEASFVRGLFILLLQMATNRPIKIADQSAYNILINNEILEVDVFKTTNKDGWAVNLGTSLEAVKAASGDLGQAFVSDIKGYKALYEDVQPTIQEDGIIVNENSSSFVIVHQWDRIPSLKSKVEKIYG